MTIYSRNDAKGLDIKFFTEEDLACTKDLEWLQQFTLCKEEAAEADLLVPGMSAEECIAAVWTSPHNIIKGYMAKGDKVLGVFCVERDLHNYADYANADRKGAGVLSALRSDDSFQYPVAVVKTLDTLLSMCYDVGIHRLYNLISFDNHSGLKLIRHRGGSIVYNVNPKIGLFEIMIGDHQ